MDDARPPDHSLPPRQRRARLLAICAIGLVLRVAWALYAAPDAVGDFRGYLDAALAVAEDPGGYLTRATAFRLPVYPLVLGTFAGMGTDLIWLRLVNVALSTGLLPLVAVLARRLGVGDRAALFAAGAAALSPTLILFAPQMATENVLLLLLVGGMAVAAAPARAAAGWRIVALGLLAGMAVLTRVEAIFVVPALLVAYAWSLRLRTGLHRRERIVRVLAVIVLAAALIGGWVQRNQTVVGAGSGLTTSAGVSLYRAHNDASYGERTPLGAFDGLGELARHQRATNLATQFVVDHPASLVLSALRGTRDLYSVPTVGTAYAQPSSVEGRVPLGILGLLTGIGAFAWRALLVLVLLSPLARKTWSRPAAWTCAVVVVGNWIGSTLVFYGESRFRMPAIAAFFIAGGVTVAGFLQRTPKEQTVARASDPDLAAVQSEYEEMVRILQAEHAEQETAIPDREEGEDAPNDDVIPFEEATEEETGEDAGAEVEEEAAWEEEAWEAAEEEAEEETEEEAGAHEAGDVAGEAAETSAAPDVEDPAEAEEPARPWWEATAEDGTQTPWWHPDAAAEPLPAAPEPEPEPTPERPLETGLLPLPWDDPETESEPWAQPEPLPWEEPEPLPWEEPEPEPEPLSAWGPVLEPEPEPEPEPEIVVVTRPRRAPRRPPPDDTAIVVPRHRSRARGIDDG